MSKQLIEMLNVAQLECPMKNTFCHDREIMGRTPARWNLRMLLSVYFEMDIRT